MDLHSEVTTTYRQPNRCDCLPTAQPMDLLTETSINEPIDQQTDRWICIPKDRPMQLPTDRPNDGPAYRQTDGPVFRKTDRCNCLPTTRPMNLLTDRPHARIIFAYLIPNYSLPQDLAIGRKVELSRLNRGHKHLARVNQAAPVC